MDNAQLIRHGELIGKKHLEGLTNEEAQELEQINVEINASLDEYYAPIKIDLGLLIESAGKMDDAQPYIVKSLIRICPAFPSQWEGVTTNNERVYIRYRYGGLRIEIDDKVVFQDMYELAKHDGFMSESELIKVSEGVIVIDAKVAESMTIADFEEVVYG